MEDDKKAIDSQVVDTSEEGLLNRRDFLDGLGKWSKIVIGTAVFGGVLLSTDREAEAWVNRGGGGGWVNRGGGGGGWVNRGGGSGWANRGGSWVNRY